VSSRQPHPADISPVNAKRPVDSEAIGAAICTATAQKLTMIEHDGFRSRPLQSFSVHLGLGKRYREGATLRAGSWPRGHDRGDFNEEAPTSAVVADP
jgi:hypothetical protein